MILVRDSLYFELAPTLTLRGSRYGYHFVNFVGNRLARSLAVGGTALSPGLLRTLSPPAARKGSRSALVGPLCFFQLPLQPLLAGLAVIALLASSAPAADLHLHLDLHVVGAPSVTPWRRLVSDPLCSTLPTNRAEFMEHRAGRLLESRVRPDGDSAMDVGPPGFEDRGPPGENVGLGTKPHDAVTPATSVREERRFSRKIRLFCEPISKLCVFQQAFSLVPACSDAAQRVLGEPVCLVPDVPAG